MNVQTQGKQKGIGYFVGVIFIVFCTGILLTHVAQAMLGGKTPQTSYAEKAYQAAAYNLCVAEQALANAKLGDFFDGFIDLSDDDVLRLKAKRENDCPLS